MSDSIFGAVMRKATQLTRERNLFDATRAIQRALTGQAPESQDQPTQLKHQLLELHAYEADGSMGREQRADDVSAETNAGFPDARADWRAAFRPLERFSTPLPDGLDFPGFAKGLSPQVKLKKSPLVRTPDGAAYLTRAFACEAGARDYTLYVPSRGERGQRPLIVMLHGCTQNPDDFAVGTGMNQLAEEHGFIVAYPRQATNANHSSCWNWFDPANQARDLGEPSIIAGLTRAIAAEFDIDASRIFVAGLSAGGAMAEIMGVTYPDIYAAAGVHSGLIYGAAADVASAFAAMNGTQPMGAEHKRMRSRGRKGRVRTIVFHGTSDRKVHPSNGDAIVAEARAGLDRPTSETQHRGSAQGRAYTRTVIADARGMAHVEHWAVEGLGHAWSGGDPEGSHTDRHGPDASREMVRFFLTPEG